MVANRGLYVPIQHKITRFRKQISQIILGISYKEMKINEYIKGVLIHLIGTYAQLSQSIYLQKLNYTVI